MAKKIIKARMQQRTDTLANWASENPVLLKGELGLVSDDPNAYKVGDGVTAWNDLPMRGWDGNITQTTGDSTTDVMSQKAVTEELDSLNQRATNLSIQANRLELTKANAVPGKGLSTNDFTDAEQQKLASLQNYDDTELRAELTELSAEVGKKADADGTYLDLTAGRSIDMLGVHEGDDSEFLFRPTDGEGSIKDGEAVVERIEGNSVVWNQMLKNDDISNTINGLTITNNGDGSWTANGTPSADVWLAIDQYPFASEVGHKYLLYGCPKGGNVGTYCLFEASGRLTVEEGNGSITAVNSTELRPYIVVRGGVVCNNLVFRPRVVDLTRMFGEGYEPLTLEEFYQRIPSGVDINAYNEGEIFDCKVQGIKSVGFNAWDEQWEEGTILQGNGEDYIDSQTLAIRSKNYDRCIPNESYYVKGDKSKYVQIFWYDADKKYIGFHAAYETQEITQSPSNAAYFRIATVYGYGTTYKNDICINLVHTGYRNGEYEPYKESEVALPILTYFPQGMRSIGSVCDEITQKQTIQRIAVREFQEGDLENSKVLTDGTKTYYELAEPIVTDIEPMLLSYEAWDFGTEQAIADAPTAPIKASIVYGFNARDTIRNNRNSIEELTRRITILEQMLGVMAAQASAVNFVE